MVLGNEYLVELEELAKQQQRIYRDAADYGLWVNSPVFRKKVSRLCKGLREIYRGKTHRWTRGSSWQCFVPFEQENGKFVGVMVRVSLCRTRNNKSFFSIDIQRDQQTENPFRGE